MINATILLILCKEEDDENDLHKSYLSSSLKYYQHFNILTFWWTKFIHFFCLSSFIHFTKSPFLFDQVFTCKHIKFCVSLNKNEKTNLFYRLIYSISICLDEQNPSSYCWDKINIYTITWAILKSASLVGSNWTIQLI